MITHSIGVVLVKLGSVLIVVVALQSLSSFSSYFLHFKGASSILVLTLVFNFLIPVAIAAGLWFFPETLLSTVHESDSEWSQSEKITHSLLSVGLFLIGVYITVYGVLNLLNYEVLRLAENAVAQAKIYEPVGNFPAVNAGRLTNAVQIIFGFALLAGRRGLSRLFYKVRYGGVDTS